MDPIHVRTESALRVVGYGAYEREDGAPMRRKDGSLVEYIEVEFPVVLRGNSFGMGRRLTLTPGYAGERPEAGAEVFCEWDEWFEVDAAEGKSGAFIRERKKYLVTKLRQAGVQAVAADAAETKAGRRAA